MKIIMLFRKQFTLLFHFYNHEALFTGASLDALWVQLSKTSLD